MTFLLLSPLILSVLTNLHMDIKFLFNSYVNLKFQYSGLEIEDFFSGWIWVYNSNFKTKATSVQYGIARKRTWLTLQDVAHSP